MPGVLQPKPAAGVTLAVGGEPESLGLLVVPASLVLFAGPVSLELVEPASLERAHTREGAAAQRRALRALARSVARGGRRRQAVLAARGAALGLGAREGARRGVGPVAGARAGAAVAAAGLPSPVRRAAHCGAGAGVARDVAGLALAFARGGAAHPVHAVAVLALFGRAAGLPRRAQRHADARRAEVVVGAVGVAGAVALAGERATVELAAALLLRGRAAAGAVAGGAQRGDAVLAARGSAGHRRSRQPAGARVLAVAGAAAG